MEEKRKQKEAWWRRGWVLILGTAVGVLLIVFGNDNIIWGDNGKQQSAQVTEPKDALLNYAEAVERRIEQLCEGVCGASEVRAAVSFAGDFTYVYATDSATQEHDGSSEQQLEYVTVGSGSSEQTVLLTRTPPAVSGIGIVCRGGGDACVRQELISLLSAAFGIGSNKIYVAEANPQK